jgi:hypothetical protein
VPKKLKNKNKKMQWNLLAQMIEYMELGGTSWVGLVEGSFSLCAMGRWYGSK